MKRINLIPPEARKEVYRDWLRRYLPRPWLYHSLAILIMVIVFLNIWQNLSIFRYKHALEKGRRELRRLREESARIQRVYARIKDERKKVLKEIKFIDAKIDFLQQVQLRRILYSRVLSSLSRLVPSSLWINKITLNEKGITIAGTTFNNRVVSNFMASIDKSEYFRNTNFTYTKKGKLKDESVINFEITSEIILEKLIH